MLQSNLPKLLVLADDFSGAAEMAGIAHAYGLKTRLLYRFDSAVTEEDVLVINTNTRSLSREMAKEKMNSILQGLPEEYFKCRFFKKIDSVLRGHIIPEIETLRSFLPFNRVFILPANPSKDRKIIDGKYFINSTPLHETIFAVDPYFPTKTSEVSEIIAVDSGKIPYCHLSLDSKLPGNGIISGNVAKIEDLGFYLQQMTDGDLLCGAADSFLQFLRKNFQTGTASAKKLFTKEFHVVLNGSSIKSAEEKRRLLASNFVIIAVPAYKSTQNLQLDNWYSEVLARLKQNKRLAIEINDPVVQSRTASEYYLQIFASLARSIINEISTQQVHFWLTGGETAAAIIDGLSAVQLNLIAQLSPGSVTFEIADKEKMHITVKPGSYSWPDHLYNQ